MSAALDNVADVAAVNQQWKLTPSPEAENLAAAAAAAGHFAYLFLEFSCAFAGQAFILRPVKVTLTAREAMCSLLRFQTGSAQVVEGERRQNEWKGCLCCPSSCAEEEDASIVILASSTNKCA